jgi:hypothetical protein
MAYYTDDNPLIKGLHGKMGKIAVYKVVRGRSFLCHPAAKPRKQSSEQRRNRELFKEAAHYARHQMLSAERKEHFRVMAVRLNLTNAYTAALALRLRELRGDKLKKKYGTTPQPEVASGAPQRVAYRKDGNQVFVDFGAGVKTSEVVSSTQLSKDVFFSGH